MSEIKMDDEGRWLVDKIFEEKELTSSDRLFLTEQLKTASDRFVLGNLFYCCRRLGDRSLVPLLRPHLDSTNVDIASGALWVLCWLGQAGRLKPYILEAADIGFARDPQREIGCAAFAGSGLHLKTHRDRDLAQLLIRWAPPGDMIDLVDWPLPAGMTEFGHDWFVRRAGYGMGLAMGADPKALIENDALLAACVKRFLAERQDG